MGKQMRLSAEGTRSMSKKKRGERVVRDEENLVRLAAFFKRIVGLEFF